MNKFLLALSIAGFSTSVLSQTAPSEQAHSESDGTDTSPSRWSLGIGAAASDSPYAGEGARVIPIPLINYQGERFFFQGITAGWQFFANESFEFATIAKARLDGFDIDDLGRRELIANGLDPRQLEDRDQSLDAGVLIKWSGVAGEIEIELLADVTDTSGGQEASIQYGYPLQWGNTRVTPTMGVTWQSDDMANYYYGTLDEEVARGVVDYKPDAVVIPHVGVNVMHFLNENWSILASLRYTVLPDEITDSRLLEPDSDGTASMMIGVSRSF